MSEETDSEPLEELLELPDELCVHGLHQDAEAWVPHQGLLRLQLLVDELMEGNTVHRVLQGQLQPGREEKRKNRGRHFTMLLEMIVHTRKKKKPGTF